MFKIRQTADLTKSSFLSSVRLRRFHWALLFSLGIASIFVVTNTRFPDFIKTLLIVLTGLEI